MMITICLNSCLLCADRRMFWVFGSGYICDLFFVGRAGILVGQVKKVVGVSFTLCLLLISARYKRKTRLKLFKFSFIFHASNHGVYKSHVLKHVITSVV